MPTTYRGITKMECLNPACGFSTMEDANMEMWGIYGCLGCRSYANLATKTDGTQTKTIVEDGELVILPNWIELNPQENTQ